MHPSNSSLHVVNMKSPWLSETPSKIINSSITHIIIKQGINCTLTFTRFFSLHYFLCIRFFVHYLIYYVCNEWFYSSASVTTVARGMWYLGRVLREFLQFWLKSSLGLKEELVRIWWLLWPNVFGHYSRIHVLNMTKCHTNV